MAELPEGTVFAGHRIDGVAGRGGMGVVYRATHLALDHVVALKVIAPELAHDDRFRERFKRECRTAVSIHHPNVVPIHHAGEEDGVLFVTMDLISGSDLRVLINAVRGLDPARAAGLVRQVAAALDAAHERGLIHRDIKPANVLVERRGEREHVYLSDFGLAKRVVGASEMTAAGSYIGTLEYMAPEQIRGGDLDIRTDVYALGGVIFAAVTGHPPFGHIDDDIAKMYAHLNEPPPPVSEARPGLPRSIDPVVAKAMAKDPDERFASAGELAAALDAAVEAGADESGAPVVPPADERDAAEEPTEPVSEPTGPTEPLPPTEPSKPSPARRRALGALAGLAVVAALAGVLVLLSGDEDPNGAGGTAGAVGALIPAGEFPVGLAVVDGQVLVSDRKSEEIAVIDEAGRAPRTPRPVGASSEAVAADDSSIWVASPDAGTVSRFARDDLESEGAIEGLNGPREIAIGDDSIWVSEAGDGTVVNVRGDPGAEELVATFDVGGEAHGVAVGEDDGFVWVVSRDGKVTVIDPATGAGAAADLGERPKSVVAAFGAGWVTVTDDGEVARVELGAGDTTAIEVRDTTAIEVDSEPRGIAAGFDAIWVANGGGTVSRIDPDLRQVTATYDVPGSPEGIAVGEDAVWVALGDQGAVVPIDPTL